MKLSGFAFLFIGAFIAFVPQLLISPTHLKVGGVLPNIFIGLLVMLFGAVRAMFFRR